MMRSAFIFKHFSKVLLLRVLLGAALALGGTFSLTQPFDSSKEFPNYFLPEQYRGRPGSEVPADILKKQRELLDQAMGSVFERLVVPIVPEGEQTVRQVRYFPYLKQRLMKLDPGMKLYASGGVVRTAMSYLYDELFQALEKDPKKDPSKVLEEIAHRKEDLPAIRVRGIGSDFDMLVQSSNGKANELRAMAEHITNSASTATNAKINNYSVKNSFFTLGDVRDYDSQIERSTRQGGSVVDYLAFDIGSQQLKDPPRFPGLADKIVSGHYEFAPPAQGAAPEDLGDSVIRGARTLLELPWLKLDNEEYYRKQIQNLNEGLDKNQALSKRAMGQFAKGIRNSRYFGAHNRFYRAKPETPDADILKLASRLGGGNSSSFLPEFADSRRIDLRKGDHSELNGLPKELLTPVSEFKAKYTDKGVLHHGTPSIENALAILRQGLFLSKGGQGTAAYGRGVYSSPHRNISEGYAGKNGLIFDLQVKDDPRVNILDWEKVKNHPAIQKIAAAAAEKQRDVFEYLSREHGIDIIKNEHVLIQNSDVVTLPGGLKAVAQSIAHELLHSNAASYQSYLEFLPLNDYLERIGEGSLIDPEKLKTIFASFFRSAMSKIQTDKKYKAYDDAELMKFIEDVILSRRYQPEQNDLVALTKAILSNENVSYNYRKQAELGMKLVPMIQDRAIRADLFERALSSNSQYFQDVGLAAMDWSSSQAGDYDPVLGSSFLEGADEKVSEKLQAIFKRPAESQKKIFQEITKRAVSKIQSINRYNAYDDHALMGFVEDVILSQKYQPNQSELITLTKAILSNGKVSYNYRKQAELGMKLVSMIQDRAIRASLFERALSSDSQYFQDVGLAAMDWSSPQAGDYDPVLASSFLEGADEKVSEKLQAIFKRPAESQKKIFEEITKRAASKIKANHRYKAYDDRALMEFVRDVIVSQKYHPNQSDLVTLTKAILSNERVSYNYRTQAELGMKLVPMIQDRAIRASLFERALSSDSHYFQDAGLAAMDWSSPQAGDYDHALGGSFLEGDDGKVSEKLRAIFNRPAESQKKIFEEVIKNAVSKIQAIKGYKAYNDRALIEFVKDVIVAQKYHPNQNELITLTKAILSKENVSYEHRNQMELGMKLVPMIQDRAIRANLFERALSSDSRYFQDVGLAAMDWSSSQAGDYDPILASSFLEGEEMRASEKLRAIFQRPAESQKKIFQEITKRAVSKIRAVNGYNAYNDRALIEFVKDVILSQKYHPNQSELITLTKAILNIEKLSYEHQNQLALGMKLVPMIQDRAIRASFFERALSSNAHYFQDAGFAAMDWSSPNAPEYEQVLSNTLFSGADSGYRIKLDAINKRPPDVRPKLYRQALEASLKKQGAPPSDRIREFLNESIKNGKIHPEPELLEALMNQHLRAGAKAKIYGMASKDLKDAVDRGEEWAIRVAKSYIVDPSVPRSERAQMTKMLPSMELKAESCLIINLKRFFKFR
jgi:nitrogen fixation protein FixH